MTGAVFIALTEEEAASLLHPTPLPLEVANALKDAHTKVGKALWQFRARHYPEQLDQEAAGE